MDQTDSSRSSSRFTAIEEAVLARIHCTLFFFFFIYARREAKLVFSSSSFSFLSRSHFICELASYLLGCMAEAPANFVVCLAFASTIFSPSL
jgi:hypothetical protein